MARRLPSGHASELAAGRQDQITFQNNRTCAERSLGSHPENEDTKVERLNDTHEVSTGLHFPPIASASVPGDNSVETNTARKSLPLRT